MAPPLYDDSKYHCCCCHVERCAWFIAFVGAALDILQAIGWFLQGKWYGGMVSLFSFLICFAIIWAQHKRSASLYLPYLIVKGIYFAVYSLVTISALVGLFLVHDEDKAKMGAVFSIVLVYTVLYGMFWHVVYRAYRYMKET